MSDARAPYVDEPLVLVIEDDPATKQLLNRVLGLEGYRVLSASGGNEGLQAIATHRPDLVLMDLHLPGVDGYEICRRLRANPVTATLPVILMTGSTDAADLVAGLDAGADDFVAKPFRSAELLARIRSAFRLRRAIQRLDVAQQVAAVLANAVAAKDPETEHHSERLVQLASRIGMRIGLDADEIEAVAYGALLHDVGKIGVPESVLGKDGPLDDAEWELMQRHPEIGERICKPIRALPACRIVRHHHERWDGTGYPDGLRGDAIPIGARIVGIVDAFDAMTHARPYRPAMTRERAVDELERWSGRQFDPELVPLMIGELDALRRSPVAVMQASPSFAGRYDSV